MIKDLSDVVGFPLYFDIKTLTLESEDIKFSHHRRTAFDMKDVLYTPGDASPNITLFHLYHIEEAPFAAMKVLEDYQLNYGFTILIPQCVGREYARTHGHFHPLIVETPYSHPEVYAQISGHMQLFLQRNHPENPEIVLECVIIDMPQGTIVTIPPNYGHMQINISGEPSLTAGLYSRQFKPVFDFVVKKKGFAYYVLCDDSGGVVSEINQHYASVPQLSWINDVQGTRFAPPSQGVQLWKDLINEPSKYAFLSDPAILAIKFPVG